MEEDCALSQPLLLLQTGGVYLKDDLARMEVEGNALDWRLKKTTNAVLLPYYSEYKHEKVLFKVKILGERSIYGIV